MTELNPGWAYLGVSPNHYTISRALIFIIFRDLPKRGLEAPLPFLVNYAEFKARVTDAMTTGETQATPVLGSRTSRAVLGAQGLQSYTQRCSGTRWYGDKTWVRSYLGI